MKKINLFVGHGKAYNDTVNDPGATSGGRNEHDEVKKFADLVKKELTKYEVEVNTIIEGNFSDGRAGYNYEPCDLGLTFHMNAFNREANGIEILKDKKTDEVGDDLRNKYLNKLSSYGFNNRGIKDYTGKLYNLKNGGDIYFELGFIDNKQDMVRYDKHSENMAVDVANISSEYLDLKAKVLPPTPTEWTHQVIEDFVSKSDENHYNTINSSLGKLEKTDKIIANFESNGIKDGFDWYKVTRVLDHRTGKEKKVNGYYITFQGMDVSTGKPDGKNNLTEL